MPGLVVFGLFANVLARFVVASAFTTVGYNIGGSRHICVVILLCMAAGKAAAFAHYMEGKSTYGAFFFVRGIVSFKGPMLIILHYLCFSAKQ